MIPLVIAHRGASADVFENTRTAIRLAREQGADLVEIDVHRSRDGVIVVHHDDDLLRSCGDPRRIDELEWSDLAAMRVSFPPRIDLPPEPLPRLDEALAAAEPAPLVVEVKTPRRDPRQVAEQVAALLRADPRGGSHVLISFDAVIAEAAAQWLGASRVGLIRNRDQGAEGWRDGLDAPVSLVVLSFRVAGRAGVEALHAAGKHVWIYALDDEPAIRAFTRLGVDGVITNRPALARRVVDSSDR